MGVGVGRRRRRPGRRRGRHRPSYDGGQRDPQHRRVQPLRRRVDRAVRGDRDALALLLVRQAEASHLGEVRPGVDGGLGVAAHDDVLPVWEERRVGGDAQHRAHLFEAVGPAQLKAARGRRTRCRRRHPCSPRRGDRWPGRRAATPRRAGHRERPARTDGTSTSTSPRPTGTRETETDVRSARLSPMSPTHTSPSVPSPAGASASTSSGAAAHVVTPTVWPEPRSTVKTRPVSPESLVVTSSPSTTASPLDSTISGSSNLITSLPADSWAAPSRAARQQPRTAPRSGPAGIAHAWRRSGSSSASLGRIAHVSTRSSYSLRTPPPDTAPPVRTARSSVLRGVCLLSTNCMTSTR